MSVFWYFDYLRSMLESGLRLRMIPSNSFDAKKVLTGRIDVHRIKISTQFTLVSEPNLVLTTKI